MSDSNPNEPDRMTRLETMVEALAENQTRISEELKELAGIVRTYATRRTDWTQIGVFCTVAFFLVGALIFGPIANLDAQDDEQDEDLYRVETRLADQIRREIDRNNEIERRLAAEEKVTELFQQGKLVLNVGD